MKGKARAPCAAALLVVLSGRCLAMTDRPAPSSGGAYDAAHLTKQFEGLLATRRLNTPQDRSRSRTSSPARSQFSTQSSSHQQSSPQTPLQQPPSYSFRSLPIFPLPPQDSSSLKFSNLLHVLSVTPTKYENPGLLDEALAHVPLDRLYAEADEECQILQAEAASMGENVKPMWGYQDCVIRALLR